MENREALSILMANKEFSHFIYIGANYIRIQAIFLQNLIWILPFQQSR